MLENGLTLIVHEDHSVPVVAVNLWYHVGSRNEARGKTGFAHLFEHFFFNGSEHYPRGSRPNIVRVSTGEIYRQELSR